MAEDHLQAIQYYNVNFIYSDLRTYYRSAKCSIGIVSVSLPGAWNKIGENYIFLVILRYIYYLRNGTI